MIVDDEVLIANAMAETLMFIDPPGFEVNLAYNASQALDLVRANEIDMMLTDIKMPGMDGVALSKLVMELKPACSIILLTGYRDFDDLYYASRADNISYILKSEGMDCVISHVCKIAMGIERRGALLLDKQMQNHQPEADNRDTQIALQVMKYIKAHLSDNITLDGIARTLGLNSSYLSRRYKQLAGISLIEQVNKAKVEAAIVMLGETDMKIFEIASSLGFISVPYFNRVFRKIRGVSPQTYRVFAAQSQPGTPKR